MDVNIIVLVKSHSGQRSPTSGPNRLTCSTGSAPHCLHFLFLPKNLFIFSPCFCVSFDTHGISALRFQGFFQVLAGHENHLLSRRNMQAFPGPGISALTGRRFPHLDFAQPR